MPDTRDGGREDEWPFRPNSFFCHHTCSGKSMACVQGRRGGGAIHRLAKTWTKKRNISESGNELAMQIKLTYQYKVFRHSWVVHQDRWVCYHHKTTLRYKLSCQQCDNSGSWWLYKCSFYSMASRSHH